MLNAKKYSNLAEQDEFELSGDFEKQWYGGF
jgi:hypothetical protein